MYFNTVVYPFLSLFTSFNLYLIPYHYPDIHYEKKLR